MIETEHKIRVETPNQRLRGKHMLRQSQRMRPRANTWHPHLLRCLKHVHKRWRLSTLFYSTPFSRPSSHLLLILTIDAAAVLSSDMPQEAGLRGFLSWLAPKVKVCRSNRRRNRKRSQIRDLAHPPFGQSQRTPTCRYPRLGRDR